MEFQVTPIHAAALAGQTDILFFINSAWRRCDHCRGRTGRTPLFLASENARLEAGQFLLNHGADIDARNEFNDTALIYATIMGNVEFARMLLDRRALVDVRGYYGRTALHLAAMSNKVQLARLLLEHGADGPMRATHMATPFPVCVTRWESRDC